MEITTLLRKVKRQVGDEYNVVVVDEDIFYWIHEAELDIVRQTASNDIQVQVAANTFPVLIQGNVMVKRVAINGKNLAYTNRNDLDNQAVKLSTEGTPLQWYWESNKVYLYPVPKIEDLYNVAVIYCRVPAEITSESSILTVPEVFHEDIAKYCTARFHNKNMNWKAAEAEMEAYDRNVSTRRNEAQTADVPLYKGVDPFDYDEDFSWL